MDTFNLVDAPWIPCSNLQSEPCELGVRAALVRAHELRELADPSPLVTVALHRLLLAIVHRMHGPLTTAGWCALWNRGQFDTTALDGYFSLSRPQFELFDAERPFYQTAMLEGVQPGPAQTLEHEAATGNNPTLFDHSSADTPRPLSPGHAARLLLAVQGYALGGGVSQPFNLSDAPLTRGFTVLLNGPTLYHTLLLNLITYNAESLIPRHGDDLPVWEQPNPVPPRKEGTTPRGYLDYLTFLSRRIHLLRGDDGLVHAVQIRQNLKLADGVVDPFKGYWRDEKRGLRPMLLRPDRALWRDSHALFESAAEGSQRPAVFNHLAMVDSCREDGLIDAEPSYGFTIHGLATEPGRNMIHLWREERLPLPLAYLRDELLRSALREALAAAEAVGKALGYGVRQLAEQLLIGTSGRTADRGAVGALSERFQWGLRYWSELEAPFKRFLVALADDHALDAFGNVVYGGVTMPAWREQLTQTGRDAFGAIVDSLDGSARALRAVAIAGRQFNAALRRALDEAAPAPAGATAIGGGA